MNIYQKLKSLNAKLSSSEKGYVKKHFNLDKEKNADLIALFSNLEKLDSGADEDAFKKKIRVKAPNLEKLSTELYSQLMICLEKYHQFERKAIRSSLNQIELLLEKNLYTQAEKLVNKVKEMTEKNKEMDMYSEVAEWEVTLFGSKPPGEELLKTFDRIFNKLENNLTVQLNSSSKV